MSRLKILLLGDEETGKTTYINRLLEANFEKSYNPTTSVQIIPMYLRTENTYREADIWDIPANLGDRNDFLPKC